MKKRCTAALVERVAQATQLCYDYVVLCAYEKHNKELTEMFGALYSSKEFKYDLRRSAEWTRFDIIRCEVNDNYLIEVCKLPTETLEEILLANEKDKYRRALKTVETIKIELATRGLLL